MKNRLACFIALVTIVTPLFSFVLPAAASADVEPSSHGPNVQISLTGTNSPQKYTVSGKLGNGTSVPFHYSNGTFTTDQIPGVGNGCTDNVQKGQQSLNITVTLGGKNAADAVSEDLCDLGLNMLTDSIGVKPPSNPTTFSGCVTYKDDQGNSQPVKSSATGELQGTKKYDLTFDDNCHIKKINVAPGDYTVVVNYAVPGGQNQNYTQKITITAGQDYVLKNAVAGNVINGNGTGQDPNGGNGNNDSNPSCESSSNFSLSWIFCPVINGLASAVDGIYSNLIQPLLQVKPVDISNSGGDPTHAYAIWSNFRIYGDVLLVIALLVVVFGESIGGGLIDAYTAKKILPRLLVAAILINISIFIVAFAVDITNIVGNGIESLIQAPFHTAACASQSKHFSAGQSCFALNISGSAADIGGLGVIGLVGVGAGSIWAAATGSAIAASILWPLLEFLLIFVLIPAFFAFIAILATLLFRQGLILFLLLISPIAFALYCLPNTEQYFRKWWDLLFKTLLIYPLIAVIFALANVLSVTIDSTTTGLAKPFADFLAIMALLAPLFLIPFSFKMAGGVIGQINEFANNARKRAHGGLIGSERDPDSWRNRTRSKLRQGRREAGLDSRIIGDSFKAVPGSGQWRQNWQSRRASSRMLEGQQFLEHDAVALANKGNDQYYLAGANPRLAKQMRDEAAAEGDEASVRSWDQAIGNAALMPKTRAIRQAMAIEHAKTGFQYAAGQEGYDQMAETAAGITGAQLVRDGAGHVTGASGPMAGSYGDLMDSMQFNEKGAGRFEFAGINRGAGYAPESGWDKASGYTGGQGKPDTYIAGAEHFLGANLKAGDNDDSGRLAARLAGNLSGGTANPAKVAEWHSKLLDAQSSATGANKREINKQIEAIETVANSTPSDDAALDAHVQLSDAVKRNRLEQRRGIDPNLLDNDQ